MQHHAPYSHTKLLIVDDDRAIRTLISKIAGSWQYETEECENAEAALTRFEEARYNIVLTDIKMGGMDGIAFAGKIREKMPSTAIIIMTGYPSSKTAQKSQDMGAIYYMQKPLDLNDLGGTLKIAAAWNISMLIDRAANRFLALAKENPQERADQLNAVKSAIKQMLAVPDGMNHLRNFVYAKSIETNPFNLELGKKFSTDLLNLS
jgi:two-component system, cell cycle response regulator